MPADAGRVSKPGSDLTFSNKQSKKQNNSEEIRSELLTNQSNEKSVTSFTNVLKKEHGIVVGSRVHTNELFTLYSASVMGEIGPNKKLLKVYNTKKWAEEHSSRLRHFFRNKSLWDIKGSPRVLRVIEDERYVYILTEYYKESIFEYAAALKNQKRTTPKQLEDLCATWFVQMLRAFSRASEKGVFFERMYFPHVFFLDDKNQVTIADFSNATFMNRKRAHAHPENSYRCKTNIVVPMASPPENGRSGELALEEDSLIISEIWLAGAAIHQILTNTFPSYGADGGDGLRKLNVPEALKFPNFTPGLVSFLSEVLDFEPEYRPKDYEAATEIKWVQKHRREAMVPSMAALRKEYKDLITSTRGIKEPKKKSSAQDYRHSVTKTGPVANEGARRILCQQRKHLRQGCVISVQLDNLKRRFNDGSNWSNTKYEENILYESFTGLLPSSVINRSPLKKQQKTRICHNGDPDLHSLTLYADDYSEAPVDPTNAQMKGVVGGGEDPPTPSGDNNDDDDFCIDIKIDASDANETEGEGAETQTTIETMVTNTESCTQLASRYRSFADDHMDSELEGGGVEDGLKDEKPAQDNKHYLGVC